MGARDRAAYFREYRRRKGEPLRAYSRAYARSRYVPAPRILSLTYTALYLRALRRGPHALASFKSSWSRRRADWNKRLEVLEQQLQVTYAQEIEKAMLDPELARLITKQALDARSFRIKHDLSFDENALEWERGRRTVYSATNGGRIG